MLQYSITDRPSQHSHRRDASNASLQQPSKDYLEIRWRLFGCKLPTAEPQAASTVLCHLPLADTHVVTCLQENHFEPMKRRYRPKNPRLSTCLPAHHTGSIAIRLTTIAPHRSGGTLRILQMHTPACHDRSLATRL